LFPQNIGMAATRNIALVEAVTKVAAKELRASGSCWNFAPVMDIGRQPLWWRFSETYAADVFIGKTMGVAAIKAYEDDGLKNVTALARSITWDILLPEPARPYACLHAWY